MVILKKLWDLLGNEKICRRIMYFFFIIFTAYSICSDDFSNWAKVVMYSCTVLIIILTEYNNDDNI